MTGSAIRLIDTLPAWVTGTALGGEAESRERLQPIKTTDVLDAAYSYGKIGSVILFGVTLKLVGHRMGSDDLISAMNDVLY